MGFYILVLHFLLSFYFFYWKADSSRRIVGWGGQTLRLNNWVMCYARVSTYTSVCVMHAGDMWQVVVCMNPVKLCLYQDTVDISLIWTLPYLCLWHLFMSSNCSIWKTTLAIVKKIQSIFSLLMSININTWVSISC